MISVFDDRAWWVIDTIQLNDCGFHYREGFELAMSGWGFGSFDNDAACDYLLEVVDDEGGVESLFQALEMVIKKGRLTDGYEASRAVAAAELIAIAKRDPLTFVGYEEISSPEVSAAKLGLDPQFLENEVRAFCASIPRDQIDELSRVALSALQVVVTESERPLLFHEDDVGFWKSSIDSLCNRLRGEETIAGVFPES